NNAFSSNRCDSSSSNRRPGCLLVLPSSKIQSRLCRVTSVTRTSCRCFDRGGSKLVLSPGVVFRTVLMVADWNLRSKGRQSQSANSSHYFIVSTTDSSFLCSLH